MLLDPEEQIIPSLSATSTVKLQHKLGSSRAHKILQRLLEWVALLPADIRRRDTHLVNPGIVFIVVVGLPGPHAQGGLSTTTGLQGIRVHLQVIDCHYLGVVRCVVRVWPTFRNMSGNLLVMRLSTPTRGYTLLRSFTLSTSTSVKVDRKTICGSALVRLQGTIACDSSSSKRKLIY